MAYLSNKKFSKAVIQRYLVKLLSPPMEIRNIIWKMAVAEPCFEKV